MAATKSLRLGRRSGVGISLLAMLAAGPARTQSVNVTTQTSLSVSCNEPSCECVDATGAPDLCPATELREYDSGSLPAPTSDSHTATVSGAFLPPFDSASSASSALSGDAAFGVLKGFVHAESEAHGTYVDAGGLAIPATASGYVSVSFDDHLIAHAATPGGSVAITFSTATHTAGQTASVSSGGLSFDPCLANGEAWAQLDVVAVVSPLGTGTGGGTTGYDRFVKECGPPQVTGPPATPSTSS